MNVLRLLPVIVSALLIAAHFLHSGLPALTLASIACPFVLFARRWWAARLVQVLLTLAMVEWIRTIIVLVGQRQSTGDPWTRLAIILSAVAAFTGASAVVFQSQPLKARYGHLDSGADSDCRTQPGDGPPSES